MPTAYTRAEAQVIWDLSLAMVSKVSEYLAKEGWTTNDQYHSDRREMRGERPMGDDDWEEFEVSVLQIGRTASFRGDVPQVVYVLGRAMMAVVGPYLDANAQH